MYKALIFFAASIVFLLPGCSPTIRPLPTPDESAKHVILFIPGFKGTALGDQENGETPWITAREALFGAQTLARNEPTLGIEGAKELVPVGVLDSVPVFPWFYSYEAYGTCLDTLTAAFDQEATVIPFAYDWREDNIETIKKLHQLILKLRESDIQRIDLVGHSMGALITAYYLRYGAQQPETAKETWEGAKLVNRVVTAGAPFRGAMAIFRDMQRGTVQVRNTALLDAEALSSFQSSYQLLPHPNDISLMSPALVPLPNLLFDVRRWNQFGWGLLRETGEPINPDVHEARYRYTAAALSRAEAFQRALNAPPKSVPEFHRHLLNIVGEGTPTLAGAILLNARGDSVLSRAELKQVLPGLSPNVLTADGDGIVTLHSAELPTALRQMYESKQIRTGETHSSLCSEGEAAATLTWFLKQ